MLTIHCNAEACPAFDKASIKLQLFTQPHIERFNYRPKMFARFDRGQHDTEFIATQARNGTAFTHHIAQAGGEGA